MDEQQALDLETKAARYDRIVRCRTRVDELTGSVTSLKATLKAEEEKLRNACWDLILAMSPVHKGVRG